MRGELGRMFLCWFIALVMVGAAIYFQPPWYVILAAIVVALIIAIVPWIATKVMRYRISNYRIDIERGLLSKRIDTLELWHVEDISFQHSLSDRMRGVGTITIVSPDN